MNYKPDDRMQAVDYIVDNLEALQIHLSNVLQKTL